MGGASEDDEAMKWFLNRANGGDVLILRTSGADGYNDYMWSTLGISLNSIETIVCHNALASQEPYITERINQAEELGGVDGKWLEIFLEKQVEHSRQDVDQFRQILRGI